MVLSLWSLAIEETEEEMVQVQLLGHAIGKLVSCSLWELILGGAPMASGRSVIDFWPKGIRSKLWCMWLIFEPIVSVSSSSTSHRRAKGEALQL
jgi:hypothetical protein